MKKLIIADDNRLRCQCCDNQIIKGTSFICFNYTTRFGVADKKICGSCIYLLNKQLTKEEKSRYRAYTKRDIELFNQIAK